MLGGQRYLEEANSDDTYGKWNILWKKKKKKRIIIIIAAAAPAAAATNVGLKQGPACGCYASGQAGITHTPTATTTTTTTIIIIIIVMMMMMMIKQEEIEYGITNQGDVEYRKINNRHREKQIKMVWTNGKKEDLSQRMCVCSNANPLHYYVLRVPCKVDRWR